MTHEAHCDQGEYAGSCKYGEPDCPALAAGWRDIESLAIRWNASIVRYWQRRQVTKARIAQQHADNRAVRRAVRRAAGNPVLFVAHPWQFDLINRICLDD